MMIESINSNQSYPSHDTQGAVQKLEQQKQKLQAQLNRIRSDKKLSKEQMQKKTAELQKQIQNIDAQIQSSRKPNSSKNAQPVADGEKKITDLAENQEEPVFHDRMNLDVTT